MFEVMTPKKNDAGKGIHLNRYYHFTELMRDPAIQFRMEQFISDFDAQPQSIFIMEPADKRVQCQKTFFFFHGMDGDAGDAVVTRQVVKDFKARVIALGGRGPSWVSDAFLADARQVLETFSKDSSSEYYLMGISMGAAQVLSLIGLLPKILQKAISGVIALMPGVDFPLILKECTLARLCETLDRSVEGNRKKLEQRSPHVLIKKYPQDMKFVLYYPENDTLFLSEAVRKFIQKLRELGFSVSAFCAPGEHLFVYKNFDFRRVIGALGGAATEIYS